MKKLELKKEMKRTALLQAAQLAFRTDGYIGANMDRIAATAGVTKQTLYRYFPSKAVLFQAALEALREGVQSRFLDELAREDTQEALTQFAIGFLRVHTSENHLAFLRLLMSEGPSAPEMAQAHFVAGPKKVNARLVEFFHERFGLESPEREASIFISALTSMGMNLLIGLHPPLSDAEMEEHAVKTVEIFTGWLS